MTGPSPAAIARRTARATRASPSRSMSSLFSPIRVEDPAARTTPATARRGSPSSRGMDAVLFLAERPRRHARAGREQLGDDREGDLVRTLRAEIQPDRTEHARVVRRADRPADLAGPRARSEQPDVAGSRREQLPGPFPVVRDPVRLDDGERARPDPQTADTVFRPAYE